MEVIFTGVKVVHNTTKFHPLLNSHQCTLAFPHFLPVFPKLHELYVYCIFFLWYLHLFLKLLPSFTSSISSSRVQVCFLASGLGKLRITGQTHYPGSAFVITVVILLFHVIAFQHITSPTCQQTLWDCARGRVIEDNHTSAWVCQLLGDLSQMETNRWVPGEQQAFNEWNNNVSGSMGSLLQAIRKHASSQQSWLCVVSL